MSQRDLSVIIPARNEIFLQRTIEDVFENSEADTEVIAICDGYWPDPPVVDHPKVTIVHHTEPIGQRAATNEGARISQAKFIMKADAHCAFGKGFDRILMEDCRFKWTMIPMMYNLNAFNWKCVECGHEIYQGVKPTVCKEVVPKPSFLYVPDERMLKDDKMICGGTDFEMVMVWKPREGKPATTSWRFDDNMQFQYWRKHRKRAEAQGDLIETLSFIGACFFIHRKRFWRLGGLDETHGSWGQFGTEIACKTWLSGGTLITSKKTWFAHMFRTGNFKGSGFRGSTWPYEISSKQIDFARSYSKDFWLNDRWSKATKPLSWLIDKFKPVPDWHEGAK